MTKIAVILNGCGHRDGSEISETVLAMLALQEAGASIECFAPDREQVRVVDHVTGRDTPMSRNMLTEAARIARGKISPLATADASKFAGVVIPGGSGTAYNLCSFATDHALMKVDPDLERLLIDINTQKKPIGAICIAPVILAKVFGRKKARITLGDNSDSAAKYTLQMGAVHVGCPVTDCIVDTENLLVTTPAYMVEAELKDIYSGIKKLAYQVVKLAEMAR